MSDGIPFAAMSLVDVAGSGDGHGSRFDLEQHLGQSQRRDTDRPLVGTDTVRL